MRTILYSTERVTANSGEAFLFIACLLVFAVIAASYVYSEGLKDERRDHWKLVLHCIMILTSVVPPELPMELSLAVNNSLIALRKVQIFCTEPFRIPSAGKVDVCCFDKTGTLTSDDMVTCGVDVGDGKLTSLSEVPYDAAFVMGACHSLVREIRSYTHTRILLTQQTISKKKRYVLEHKSQVIRWNESR